MENTTIISGWYMEMLCIRLERKVDILDIWCSELFKQ